MYLKKIFQPPARKNFPPSCPLAFLKPSSLPKPEKSRPQLKFQIDFNKGDRNASVIFYPYKRMRRKKKKFYYFTKLLVFNESYDFLHQLFELENFTTVPCCSSHLVKVLLKYASSRWVCLLINS